MHLIIRKFNGINKFKPFKIINSAKRPDMETESVHSYIAPPTPPPRTKAFISKSSIKKRLTCICKQESVDSGGSNVKIEDDDKSKEKQEPCKYLLSPVSGAVSSAIASSPTQPTEPLVKTQFPVQSKSEQQLRPATVSVAGQQRKSFNAMSDFTSVKPLQDYANKTGFRRNSLQFQTSSTRIPDASKSGLSRLLSADLSSAEFYAATGWPKAKESISPSLRAKAPPSESIVEEEKEKDSEQGSIVAPLLSERLKAEYDAAERKSNEDDRDLEPPDADEEDSDDYDDYDYDIEDNFKYAKRDSQISQMLMMSNLDPNAIQNLQPEEKKMSRSKRLTQKGKKMRRTVFKLSKRIKRKLNGGADKDKDKDDEKSQSLEIKEDKPSISFLDRLSPSPKTSKNKQQISSNKSSFNELSQELMTGGLTDREGSSTNEETQREETKLEKSKHEDKKEVVDENYQNTKKKLLSRPRALSNIAASLRFAPIPAIAVAGFNLPTDNLMSSEFYSKNKKKDDQEVKKQSKQRTDGSSSAIPNINLLTAAFPVKSRKSPMRASYHGKTNYQLGFGDKNKLRADAFNVRLQRSNSKRRTATNQDDSNPEVVGSAESLVTRVLQEQGLGKIIISSYLNPYFNN